MVTLPKGLDPDSLLREKGDEALKSYLEQRRDFFDYKFSILSNTYDPASISGKTAISQQMLVTIAKLQSEVAKYEYIRKLARRLEIKEEVLIAEFRQTNHFGSFRGKNSKARVNQFQESAENDPLPLTEKILLKVMLTNPRAFAMMRKNVQKDDFASAQARRITAFLFEQTPVAGQTVQQLVSSLTEKDFGSLVAKILLDETIPQDKESFRSSLDKLKDKRKKIKKAQLKEEIRQAEASGDQRRLKTLLKQYTQSGSETKK